MKSLYVLSGASGMTGSELVRQILESEKESRIIGFDNFFASSIDTVKEYLNNPRFVFYEYDINTGKSTLLVKAAKEEFADWAKMYALGYEQVLLAEKHRVCPKIYVYIQMGKDVTVSTETAPCYDEYLLKSTEKTPFG